MVNIHYVFDMKDKEKERWFSLASRAGSNQVYVGKCTGFACRGKVVSVGLLSRVRRKKWLCEPKMILIVLHLGDYLDLICG